MPQTTSQRLLSAFVVGAAASATTPSLASDSAQLPPAEPNGTALLEDAPRSISSGARVVPWGEMKLPGTFHEIVSDAESAAMREQTWKPVADKVALVSAVSSAVLAVGATAVLIAGSRGRRDQQPTEVSGE